MPLRFRLPVEIFIEDLSNKIFLGAGMLITSILCMENANILIKEISVTNALLILQNLEVSFFFFCELLIKFVSGSTKCEDCKNTVEYYLKFGLSLLLQVAVILGIFKFNQKQDVNYTFYMNVIKIFINFIQISSILLNYDLDWSALVSLISTLKK